MARVEDLRPSSLVLVLVLDRGLETENEDQKEREEDTRQDEVDCFSRAKLGSAVLVRRFAFFLFFLKKARRSRIFREIDSRRNKWPTKNTRSFSNDRLHTGYQAELRNVKWTIKRIARSLYQKQKYLKRFISSDSSYTDTVTDHFGNTYVCYI